MHTKMSCHARTKPHEFVMSTVVKHRSVNFEVQDSLACDWQCRNLSNKDFRASSDGQFHNMLNETVSFFHLPFKWHIIATRFVEYNVEKRAFFFWKTPDACMENMLQLRHLGWIDR